MLTLFAAVVNAEQLFAAPIYGLYQSLPDESEGGPDKSKIDQVKPTGQGAPPPPPASEGPNAIARDRIESPQDR